jgi:hypothetical protein
MRLAAMYTLAHLHPYRTPHFHRPLRAATHEDCAAGTSCVQCGVTVCPHAPALARSSVKRIFNVVSFSPCSG